MTDKRLRVLILGAVLPLSLASANADPVLEETIEKTYPVEPTAKFSIRNDDGAIWIYGADVKEMKVQAIKKAYSADRLNNIAVNISVKPGEVSIDTQYPPKPKWGLSDRSGTVDYVIVLPWHCDIARADLANGELLVEGMRGGNVHANLGSGRLFGHNCFANLHVAVANGGLDVAYDWWEEGKFSVDAEIINGNAHAFIPGDASFHLVAVSANGNIASEFNGKENRRNGLVQKIDVIVGSDSGADLKIHATNGSIKIAEAYP